MVVMHSISLEWLNRYSSPNGGYNSKQLAALGISFPLDKDWKASLVGKCIPPQLAKDFEQAAGDFAKPLPPAKPKKKKPAMTEEERKARLARRRAKKSGKVKAKKVYAPFNVDPLSDDFLKSFAWRKLRMEALIKYGVRCMCCGASPATGAVMNVDHIKPRKLFPSLALDINNLQILCEECNHGKGNWSQKDWR